MRLGRLILQICAVLVGLAIIAGAYVMYRENQIQTLSEELKKPSLSISQHYDVLLNAPSAICRMRASAFETATRAELYLDSGRLMLVIGELARPQETQYQIVNKEGMHVWRQNADYIVFADMESILQLPDSILTDDGGGMGLGAVIADSECEIWWNPDDSIFRIPSHLPIVNYEDF